MRRGSATNPVKPQQLILDIPMLADHHDEGGSRPHHAGKIEAVVTRNWRLLVGHPNGFHSNHRLEARPFRQCRQGLYVRHCPDASAHAPAVGIVEGIKEIVRITSREIMLNMLMKVRFDSRVGLFVIAL